MDSVETVTCASCRKIIPYLYSFIDIRFGLCLCESCAESVDSRAGVMDYAVSTNENVCKRCGYVYNDANAAPNREYPYCYLTSHEHNATKYAPVRRMSINELLGIK